MNDRPTIINLNDQVTIRLNARPAYSQQLLQRSGHTGTCNLERYYHRNAAMGVGKHLRAVLVQRLSDAF